MEQSGQRPPPTARSDTGASLPWANWCRGAVGPGAGAPLSRHGAGRFRTILGVMPGVPAEWLMPL